MQGGWLRRQGQDLCAGGRGVGFCLRCANCSIGATHGVVDKHADNCNNASTNISTNTVKNTSANSAVFEQNDDGIHSARAKAGTTTIIGKARRRLAASRVVATPTLPALLLLWGGWHTRTLVAATATMTKTKTGMKMATGTKTKIATTTRIRRQDDNNNNDGAGIQGG